MSTQQISVLLLLLATQGGPPTCLAEENTPVESVKDLIDRIVVLERATRVTEVTHFRGRALIAELDGPYNTTPRVVEGSVTYDGVPGGRFMAIFAHNVLPIGESMELWLDSSGGESFDGSEGRRLEGRITPITTIEGRTPAKPRDSNSAWITSTSPRPTEISPEGFFDGSLASLGYFPSYIRVEGSRSQLLGDSLLAMYGHGRTFSLSKDTVTVAGRETLKLVDLVGNTYWFDKNCGYALCRAKGTKFGPLPYDTLVVEQLTKLGTGAWYATKGYWEGEIQRPERTRKERIEFSAEGVRSDSDTTSEFSIAIPSGYKVYDRINETVFKSGVPAKPRGHPTTIVDDSKADRGTVRPAEGLRVTSPENAGWSMLTSILVIWIPCTFAICAVLWVVKKRSVRSTRELKATRTIDP